MKLLSTPSIVAGPKNGVPVPANEVSATLRGMLSDPDALAAAPSPLPWARERGLSYLEGALERLQARDAARDTAPPSGVPHQPIVSMSLPND